MDAVTAFLLFFIQTIYMITFFHIILNICFFDILVGKERNKSIDKKPTLE